MDEFHAVSVVQFGTDVGEVQLAVDRDGNVGRVVEREHDLITVIDEPDVCGDGSCEVVAGLLAEVDRVGSSSARQRRRVPDELAVLVTWGVRLRRVGRFVWSDQRRPWCAQSPW